MSGKWRKRSIKDLHPLLLTILFCSGAIILYIGATLAIKMVMLVGFITIFGAILFGVAKG